MIQALHFYSSFCVPAKVIKLVGLANGECVGPTNLLTFAGTLVQRLTDASN
jgi:hypothetical protein